MRSEPTPKHDNAPWLDDPFDRADFFCSMASWHVTNLLKSQCNLRRRAALRMGPDRRTRKQGGDHG